MSQQYDVIVLGSGPGGYVAAIRCAQLGLKTAIVERENLGGICLNWGCIPTKALLRSAEIFHYATHAKSYGLTIDGKVGFDAAAIVQRSRGVSGQLNGGVGFLLKKNKVDVIWGEASITKPGEVVVAADVVPAARQSPGRRAGCGPEETGAGLLAAGQRGFPARHPGRDAANAADAEHPSGGKSFVKPGAGRVAFPGESDLAGGRTGWTSNSPWRAGPSGCREIWSGRSGLRGS